MSLNIPRLLIFRDLDGTLLDHETYEWNEAMEALDLFRIYHVPIILASGKTRAEMELISLRLGLNAPFVSENGGGIFFPKEFFPDPPFGTFIAQSESYMKYSSGVSYHEFISALKDFVKILGWTICGFFDMKEKIGVEVRLNGV